MNKRKKKFTANYTIIAVIGILAISTIAFAYSGYSPKVVVEGDYIESPGTTVNQADEMSLGAFPGPDIYTDRLCVNDLCKASDRVTMTTASSTVCTIQSPNSTSTLTYLSADFSVASSAVASGVNFSRSATLYGATTTNIFRTDILANKQKTIVASGTDLTTSVNNYFAPNTYLQVSLQGAEAGCVGASTCPGLAPSGYCQTEFTTTRP